MTTVPNWDDVSSAVALLAGLGEEDFAAVVTRVHAARGAGRRPRAVRCRLPDERESVTHHFVIRAHVGGEVEEVDGYVMLGLYPDGSPGEIFIRMGWEHGSTVQGFADGWATAFSILLQVGVPLRTITGKFRRVRFEPSGRTDNPDVPTCTSLPDYVCAWLERRYPEEVA